MPAPRRPGPRARPIPQKEPFRLDVMRRLKEVRSSVAAVGSSTIARVAAARARVDRQPDSWLAVVVRVIGITCWALLIGRLVTTAPERIFTVDSISIWVIAAAGSLVGVACWFLPRRRGRVERPLALLLVLLAVPVLVESLVGKPDPTVLLGASVVATVAAMVLLPTRIALGAGLLGVVAASVPLLAGSTVLPERSLLAFAAAIGILTSAHTRILGTLLRRHTEEEQRGKEIAEAFMATVATLTASSFAQPGSIEARARRTAFLAVAVARRLGLRGHRLRVIQYAALLHDVGRAGIPGSLLNKAAALTPDELVRLREHPVIAERLLSPVLGLASVCAIIRGQYERWNGSGYPDGLAAQAIPMGARILHACAAYTAMSSDRPYRAALSREAIFAELRRQAGTQFDPRVVQALVALVQSQSAELASQLPGATIEAPAPQAAAPSPASSPLSGMLTLAQAAGRNSVEDVCRLTGEAVRVLLPCDQCRVLLAGADLVPSLAYVAQSSRQESTAFKVEGVAHQLIDSIVAQVVKNRRGVVFGNAAKHPSAPRGAEAAALQLSVIAVPVLAHKELVGVIVVLADALQVYGADQLRLVQVLADQMGASVANARLIERLGEASKPASSAA